MRISKKVLCAGAVIVFGTALEAGAQTTAAKVRACVGPSGSVRIVGLTESCKANESALEWGGGTGQGPQGPMGPAGPAGPPGPQGPAGTSGSDGSIRVTNANGIDIGTLLDPTHVAFTLPSGRKSYAQLLPGGPPSGWTMTHYYTTADCSGDPYVSWNSTEDLLSETVVLRAGAFAIVPGSLAQRQTMSRRAFGDTGLSSTCVVGNMNILTSRFDFYLPADLNLLYPLAVH
jgi:hypothetical protein